MIDAYDECIDCDADSAGFGDLGELCKKCFGHNEKYCGRCGDERGWRPDSKFGSSLCLGCWVDEYAYDLGHDDWQNALKEIDKVMTIAADLDWVKEMVKND